MSEVHQISIDDELKNISKHPIDVSEQLAEKANQSDLNTTNSNITTNTNAIGTLSQLNTTDKSSLVNALKEVKTQSNTNQTSISNIGNGSPKGTYATLSALQTAFPTGTTGVYIVTADGGWYYWSGSAWTKGGTYQSTSVANGSITSAMRTPIGTHVFCVATKFDYNTTSKLLTWTGLYVNYFNKAVSVPDGSLDLSSSTYSAWAFVCYDTVGGSLVAKSDNTGQQETYVLIAVLNILNLWASQLSMGNFTINGSTNLVKTTGRTQLGTQSYAVASKFDYNVSTKKLSWSSLWVNYWNKSVNIPDNSGMDVSSFTSNLICLLDTTQNIMKLVSGQTSLAETDIFLAYINVLNPTKQSVCVVPNWTVSGVTTTPSYLLTGKKFTSLGDSITSDQVTGLGTTINSNLGTTSVGNYACGWATAQDWQDTNGNNITSVTLAAPNNANTNDNVLSNQVRRLLQHTTASGAQITWTHPTDGTFSLDTTIGTGLGNTGDIPNIIYIAISTNDGENTNTPIVDDTATVFGQTYTQLTRLSIASSIRWAIETLQSAYPNANIFVASPLQTGSSNAWMSYNNELIKRSIIEKVCEFCSVHYVDSFRESGYSMMKAKSEQLSTDGIHPNTEGKVYVGNYVANEINKRFVTR